MGQQTCCRCLPRLAPTALETDDGSGSSSDAAPDSDPFFGPDPGLGSKAAFSAKSEDANAAGLHFEPIRIKDKPRFDALFAAIQPQISDLTFSNLLMWRRMINFQASWAGGFAVILAIPRQYPPYAYAPVGDMSDEAGFAKATRMACEHFRANGWEPRFRCVPADVVPALERALGAYGLEPSCEPDRDFFDYVYRAEDLIGLRGKNFDGKRNHISRFRRTYEFEYEELAEAHIGECIRIMHDRCVANDCACLRGDYGACDRMPSMELLAHFGELSCQGAIVKVDGRYEAFTVGEALNANTAVIYIEKANSGVNGLYAFINQQFCEHAWSGMAHINREEDEGVEGLRKAKLSYHPEFLVEKFTVTAQAALV